MEEIKYKILIVDENDEQIDDFKTFIESLSKDIEVSGLDTLSSDDELLEFINDNEIDAVAFDYKLKENNSAFIQNGDAYQMMLLDNFENFPTFIITNNAADSKSIKADPFKIIDKSVINYNSEKDEEVKEGVSLIEKIRQSIDSYRENIISYENELSSLIELQSSGKELSDEQIRKMIDLDSKLENSISKKSRIPKDWKSPAAIEEISTLVANSADILNELKKLNGK
jgi:hypothetical protein